MTFLQMTAAVFIVLYVAIKRYNKYKPPQSSDDFIGKVVQGGCGFLAVLFTGLSVLQWMF